MDPIVDRLAAAIAQGDSEEVDNAWLELLEAESIAAEAIGRQLARLVEQDQGPQAVDLVLALAPDLARSGRHAEALPLLRAVAPAARDNEDVRAALIDGYRALFGDQPHISACIDSSGLLSASDLAAAVAALDRLLSYKQGDFLYHPSGWGTGRIVEFDPLTGAATIDFEHRPGHQVPLETIDTIFVRLQPDDFRVVRLTGRERLRQLAQDDPAALVRMVLAAYDRRVSQRQLRGLLSGEIVPPDQWPKWWSRARAALTRDPLVSLARGSNPVLSLRAEALTYEDEMRARFEQLRDLAHQSELVREYLGHMANDADPEAFLRPAAQALAAAIPEAEPGAAFEGALLLTRLPVDAGDHPEAQEILAAQPDPFRLLNGLETTEGRRRAFEMLRDHTDALPALCYQILLRGPAELWEAAIGQLPTAGEGPCVQRLVDELLDTPKRHLELFAWLARGLLSGRWHVAASAEQVFDALLAEGDDLARRRADTKTTRGARFEDTEALHSIRQALRTGGFAYFEDIVRQSSEGEAGRLLFRIRQSTILSASVAHSLERTITRHHPRLVAEEPHPAAGPEFIYATPEGIERRRRERERLVNVLIPENAKAIGRAAAQGDISDNADWRAAIEERDRLSRLAAQMTQELQRARPIEPSMVHTEHVSIGSRVTVEDAATGQQATYGLLGPWDADPERHIIPYTSPLAQALLRRRVGERVVFEHAGQATEYRVVAIATALATKPR